MYLKYSKEIETGCFSSEIYTAQKNVLSQKVKEKRNRTRCTNRMAK
jgi:hypothetical protein